MIKYKKDTDQIVTLTLEMTGRSANIINHKLGLAFLPVLAHLKKEKEKKALKGIIIRSAKKTFLTGGDLDYLYQSNGAAEIYKFSQTLQSVFRELEAPGIPVVAAINGAALGNGFELALACHHRIAIDNPKTRLGHPEVKLGIMPGNGGTIRLLWTLGLVNAFDVLSEGTTYSPRAALKLGIIDALATDEADLLDQASAWILAGQEGRRIWDKKGGTIRGGSAKDPSVAQSVQFIAAGLAKKYRHNFPAPQAILNTLVEGSKVDFDTACRIESRSFTELVLSKAAKNMTKAFWYDVNAIRSGENRPKGYGKFRPRRIGIIGAGNMGSGIALACLMRGLEVVVKDITKEVAERSRIYVKDRLLALVAQDKITEQELEERLQRLETTEFSEAFEHCDLVIEAVFENQNLKAKVTKEAEVYMDEYSLFASNTSSIHITDLAKHSSRPENFVGLHFFAPAAERPVVEIVRGKLTSDETIARAFDFVKAIKKTPLIVKDSWGFYASRVQNTYILEGIYMLQEGYPPALIENLGRQVGMSKPALMLADELSMAMVLRYENQAAELYGPQYIQHPAVEVLLLMKDTHERLGKRKLAGFYDYEPTGEYKIWEGLTTHFPTQKEQYDTNEIKERFLFVQVLEAVWCLQEGVIGSIPEANLGSIYGWGFPSFKGGVIQYINDYGLADFVERCGVYEKQYGPRYKAPPLLLKKAKAGSSFE
ncbi:MAG: 3-hydroxyacyl-CoA dehydrogenase NAD-binding domain-containing protein [Saprospiraceae bacterium]